MATARITDVELRNLLEPCARQDAAAQRRVYESLYAFAMSIALHYAGNREEGEEITQDSFVKLFRHLGRGQSVTGCPRAYLSRIVINTSIDLLRRRNRQLFTVELPRNVRPLEGGDARNAGSDRLEAADLYALLQKLPPSYRLVFNLHALEGYTHPEIAARLGISEGTSKSNLAKARQKLRHWVELRSEPRKFRESV